MPTFTDELRALYEAAGGQAGLGYGRLIRLAEQHGHKVAKQNLSDWFRKAPPQEPGHVAYLVRVLIPFLEDRAELRSPGHGRTPDGVWGRRLKAAQSVRNSGRGGRGSRVHAASPGRLLGGLSQPLRDVLPRAFVGREQELAAMTAFVTGPDDAPAYLWWQAGPWAGKTALLSWFAVRELPAGVDVAHYVIAGRLGTDRRDGFVRAIGEQLAAAAGNRRYSAVDRKQPTLDPLYEAAARECAGRDRRLVLIVDGLDEDADAGLDGAGIAGLLPKVPPYGMRVIVTGRPHPRVPVKLAPDHPLRDPAVVRRLTDSPAARVIRDTAMAELRTLLDDRGIGRRLLGLLVSARGALTGADLGEILDITPYDVQDELRTVVGRSMAPTRADLLPLDVRTEAEAEAGRQTFVLAHHTLHVTACEALGRRFLTERTHDLDRWAQQYRDEGWPKDTPNYLLTGYTRLLHERGRTDELAALVLDPQRQLRLVQRSGTDVALAQLDLIAPSGRDRLPARDGATAAAAAVSRELLLAHVRPLPRSVAETVARLGDGQRARALARSSGHAVDKALNLAGVAHVLRAMGDEQAAATAREAGEWAHSALREADRLGHVADGAAARAAVALLATALTPGKDRELRDQYADGLALLRSARGTSTARNEAWALAAGLLAPDHPEHAAELLDELEEQAETLAAGDPAEGAAAAGAVQLWQTVASAAPDRADRLHDRVAAYATDVWRDAPTLENLYVIATAASLVARSRPAQAGHLVAAACRHLDHVPHTDAGALSPADAFHVEFGFRHTLTVLSRALTDVGTSPDTTARVLGLGQRLLPPEPTDQPGRLAPDEDDDQAFAEATGFADRALRLAGQGAVNEAEHHLEQALALLPTAGSGTDRGPVWLPDLAGALIRTDATSRLEPLLDVVRHPADRVRVHAAMALAYADSPDPLRMTAARDHAREAARAAADPAASGTGWSYAAQALACAGEVEPSLDLIVRHERPDDVGRRAAWRKADRAARIAVATELSTRAPEAAGEPILPLLKRLDAARHAVRSQGLLPALAELLPATARLSPEQQALFDSVMETAREQVTRSSPQSWQHESVLVLAFLRVGAGEEPGRQLDWLAGEMANRGTERFPTAALAVLHAAVRDTTAAQRVAALPAAPHRRAAALTAVASHLARVPARPCPVPDPIGVDRFTHTIQHLALKVTSATRPDGETPLKLLHRALTTAGWYHAIPVLARLAPEAVAALGDATVAHLGTSRVSRT